MNNITYKKPPDKYKCIKVPFNKVFLNNGNQKKLFDVIVRTNKITIKTYQLLRLWILDKYHKNEVLPLINENTIKMAQKSILKKSRGPKPKGKNLEILNEFSNYNFDLEDGLNLSQILGYSATSILTSIENNIKSHYFDYIRRFLNAYFKHKYKEEIKDKEFKKQLFKDLKKIKNDIIENTKTCKEKYQDWLEENRYNIIPKICHKNGYYYDIYENPQKYLKHMIWMNIELEKIEGKMFQFFPLRTDIIVKHCPIDTKSIIEIFVEKDKNKYLKNIEKYKDELWNKYFNINIKVKNYSFDYTVITDCCSLSLRYIHNNFIEEEKIKKSKMRNARQQYKGLSIEDKNKLKKELKEKKKLLKEKIKKEKEEREKELYKGLTKKEIKELKLEKKKSNYIEFPYIDEINKNELNGKHIFIDPGKRDLLSIIDDNGNRMTYSNKRRVKETKRLKYQRLIKNLKDKLEITPIENKLSIFNSKTCDLDKFKIYIKEKNIVNNKLFKLYENKKFRQYKWYSFINKKRTEDNMINLIKNKFGNDLIVIHGDWSIKKQMRNFISTPNLGIKRKLKEHFKVFNIDEFRTSCLYHKTGEKGNNLYYEDKKKREILKNKINLKNEDEKNYINNFLNKKENPIRKLHSVLTFKMENNRKGCINRDYNGCLNIRKLFNCYINNENRPLQYSRGYNLEKNTNPSLDVSNGIRLGDNSIIQIVQLHH